MGGYDNRVPFMRRELRLCTYLVVIVGREACIDGVQVWMKGRVGLEGVIGLEHGGIIGH